MRLRFWGVRGSFVAAGPEFQGYGGDTSAVEVISSNGDRLLLDLGTGAIELARELLASEFGKGQGKLTILLSHTHIDHIQGLPFFSPLFVRGNSVRILGTLGSSGQLRRTLQAQLDPNYSPLFGLENLAAGVSVEDIEPEQEMDVDGFNIRAILVPHGTTISAAYRIHVDGKTVVYMTDVEHGPHEFRPSIVAFATEADLLIHDAMYSDAEYETKSGWGHCSISMAVAFARATRSKALALFHYAPDTTDVELDRLVRQIEARDVRVFPARQSSGWIEP